MACHPDIGGTYSICTNPVSFTKLGSRMYWDAVFPNVLVQHDRKGIPATNCPFPPGLKMLSTREKMGYRTSPFFEYLSSLLQLLKTGRQYLQSGRLRGTV